MTGDGRRSNPYVGLRPFERADCLSFFGRRAQVAELLQRLNETRFVAVVGSSGCGKSSLIRAGLIPALLGGFLVQDRDRWLIAKMKPGTKPIGNLARALCSMEDGEARANTKSAKNLQAAIVEYHGQAVLDHLKPQIGSDTNLLLLLDQFEEIFKFRGGGGEESAAELGRSERLDLAQRQREAADFVDLILSLAEQQELPVYVVLTMRSDFLGDCDLFFGLPEAMNRSRYLVPRLKRGELREAIEGPPLLLGQRLAPRLVDELLNELGDRSDQLPILQHALLRSWDFWQRKAGRGPIDLEHYLDAGTVREALPRHANEALRDADLPVTARIFKCLTDTDPNHRRVRRAATLSELVAVTGVGQDVVESILQRFNEDGRNFLLLSSDIDSNTTQVEISHESLIRQWDQLARWVDEERESRDQFRELLERARGGRALLQDPDLQIALNWRATARPTEAWARRYSRGADDLTAAIEYLERSRLSNVEAANRRRRTRNAVVAAALLIGLALSALSLWALDNAARARDTARVGMAHEWMEKDPTLAALFLLEVRRPERTRFAAPKMRELLEHTFAVDILRGHQGRVPIVAFSSDGNRIVTGSDDGTARVWSTNRVHAPIALRGHDGEVRSAAFSPDGSRIVTGSSDSTARVWNADGSGEPTILRGHQGWIQTAAFSPDGSRIVTASNDGTARVWRMDGESDPVVLLGHEDALVSAVFSPDGARILTASEDGTARLWSPDDSRAPVVFRGHQGSLTAASFSPDGTRIVTAAADGTTRVWRADGSAEPIILGTEGSLVLVESAVFSPDGTKVLTNNLQTNLVRIWNADGSGEPLGLVHDLGARGDGFPLSASFSPDGSRIVTASFDGTARVWNADGSGEPVVLRGHEAPVWGAAFSPDGSRIVTGSDDGTARLWNVGGLSEPIVLRGHQDWVQTAAFSPDGTQILTGSEDATARVWRSDGSGQPVVLHGHDDRLTAADFSPDGTRIVTSSDDRTARVWRADGSGQPIVLRGHERRLNAAAFSPDGARIVTGSDDATARVWNADGSGLPVVLRGHERLVMTVAFSPDGARVVTGSDDETARVWNADGSGEPVVLRGHERLVNGVAFSPDGTRVVTASGDDTARIWSADGSGEPVVLQHDGWVQSAAFSPDGSRIVTASDDGTARVWRGDGPGEPVVLRGHWGPVLMAAFSADGTRVVTVSCDKTARVWNADGSGEPVILRGHEDRLTTAAFSRDGRRVVTASHDGTARVWVYRADLLQRAIASATQACLAPSHREVYLDESADEAQRQFDRCERRQGRAR